jgi:hypothetical protein
MPLCREARQVTARTRLEAAIPMFMSLATMSGVEQVGCSTHRNESKKGEPNHTDLAYASCAGKEPAGSREVASLPTQRTAQIRDRHFASSDFFSLD